MLIVFDLDGVLFDVKKFKEALRKIFNGFGISNDLFDQTYQLSKKDKGYYQWRLQIDVLGAQNLKVNFNGLKEKLEDFLKNCREFLFVETKNVLAKLKKENKLFLLTFGDRELHLEMKIKNCGLEKYFDRIIFAGSPFKDEEIRELIETHPGEEIIFIEDNHKAVEKIRELFPHQLKVVEKQPDESLKKSLEKYFPNLIYENFESQSAGLKRK